MALLHRASTAVRRAHAIVEQSADETFLASVENHTLVSAEHEARDDLEAVVRRFAARLRAEGDPPESAVRRVKSVVEPVIFSPIHHGGADVEWRRAVASDVVKWLVESYYAA